MISVTLKVFGDKPKRIDIPDNKDPFEVLARAMLAVDDAGARTKHVVMAPSFPESKSAPVAQTAERGARNSEVVGSNPTGGSREFHPSGVRDTSYAAYSKLSFSGKLTEKQQEIHNHLVATPMRTWTRTELAEALGIRINSVTGRVTEMLDLGDLEECGKRACKITGEMVYELRIKK